jgi:hypothetical protein
VHSAALRIAVAPAAAKQRFVRDWSCPIQSNDRCEFWSREGVENSSTPTIGWETMDRRHSTPFDDDEKASRYYWSRVLPFLHGDNYNTHNHQQRNN